MVFYVVLILFVNLNAIISKKFFKQKDIVNSNSNTSFKKKYKYSKRKLEENDDEPEEYDYCTDLYSDKEHFYPLKIVIDYGNLEHVLESNLEPNNYNIDILNNSLNTAKEALESILTMCGGTIPTYESTYIQNNFQIYNFNEDLLSNIIAENISIIVWFKADSIGDKLASSKIIINDGACGQPQIGVITFNKNINYLSYEQKFLNYIMLRQLTHLLGFHKYFINNEKPEDENSEENNDVGDDDDDDKEVIPFIGLIKEDPSNNYYYVDSTQVIEYAKKYFDCSEITKLDITIDDDDLPHWSSRYLLGDYMTDKIYPEEQVMSMFTLLFFKDLGYLDVKPFSGGLMRYGKHRGCDFIKEKCVLYESNALTKKHENDFYYPKEDEDFVENLEPSCSSGRLSKTVHKLHVYSNEEIPEMYRYFPSPHTLYGGIKETNFCPISEYSSYINSAIYKERCSESDIITEIERDVFGESRSQHSFCALNTFVKKSSTNNEEYKDKVRAGCFKMYCSSESLTIQVGEDYLVCPKEGGRIESDNYDGYILCPDYNLICTSTNIMCNDLFDCIANEAEEKEESLTYDYVIKTTQDSSIYKTAPISQDDFSEQDEFEGNGKCPPKCEQCKGNLRCFKCKNSYGLLGKNEDSETEKIICKENTILNNGEYYTKNVNSYIIYYPCIEKIDNCKKCQDSNTCIECEPEYKIDSNNHCEEKIENCETYNADYNSCTKCKDGFSLIKGEKTSCMDTVEMNNQVTNKYYYKVTDNPDYYVKCSYKIQNCEKCEGENICNECKIGFGMIDDDKSHCEDLSTNLYFLDTDSKYKLCNTKLDNCKTCLSTNNILDCQSCLSNEYSLVHGEDNNECKLKTLMTNDNKYFSDDNGLNYYLCKDIRYHSVSNCLLCNNKDSCEKCQTGYELFNSNNLCITKIEINTQISK